MMPEFTGTLNEEEMEMQAAYDAYLEYAKENPYPDMVNSPEHYTSGGIETIDVIEAKLTPEEYRGYLKGNVLKYLLRANYKGKHDEDICKAYWYMGELDDVTAEK